MLPKLMLAKLAMLVIIVTDQTRLKLIVRLAISVQPVPSGQLSSLVFQAQKEQLSEPLCLRIVLFVLLLSTVPWELQLLLRVLQTLLAQIARQFLTPRKINAMMAPIPLLESAQHVQSAVFVSLELQLRRNAQPVGSKLILEAKIDLKTVLNVQRENFAQFMEWLQQMQLMRLLQDQATSLQSAPSLSSNSLVQQEPTMMDRPLLLKLVIASLVLQVMHALREQVREQMQIKCFNVSQATTATAESRTRGRNHALVVRTIQRDSQHQALLA